MNVVFATSSYSRDRLSFHCRIASGDVSQITTTCLNGHERLFNSVRLMSSRPNIVRVKNHRAHFWPERAERKHCEPEGHSTTSVPYPYFSTTSLYDRIRTFFLTAPITSSAAFSGPP